MYNFDINRELPPENPDLVRRLSQRWMRAVRPHNIWAKTAKECTDFLEGRQWSPEAQAEMDRMKRPTIKINKIAPLWRLVMGYQTSNRFDATFLPTSDSQSSEDLADCLSNVWKTEGNRMDMPFVDSDVFADGITTGRGFWDMRLSFEDNDLGEMAIKCDDPFSIYMDPDGSEYDLEKNGYIQESRWASLEEIGTCYGKKAADSASNILSPTYGSTLVYSMGLQDVSPSRFYGQYENDKSMNWNDVYYQDFVDNQAKSLRLIDTQYKIARVVPCFVDLETGDYEPVPDDWFQPENKSKIQACLDYGNALGNPIEIRQKMVRKVRWTVSLGDLLLFDKWSPYNHYTKVGFFPYFRRGTTRGMIEDLIDPQKELNKKRSSLTDILSRNANSGWIYSDKMLDAKQEENLRRYGSSAGIHVKYKETQAGGKPERLEAGNYPQGLDRLEQKAADDLYQISGVNESAMGQLDRVQSGRAIEARQRQAVLAIQLYQDNFTRSKKHIARKGLNLMQKHYTENRMFRIMGEDGTSSMMEVNKKMQTGQNSMTRMNDITIGKYSVTIDAVPISATFKQAQFEETMDLLQQMGPLMAQMMMQTNPSLIIDQTSIPRKQEWKQALSQAASQAAMQQQASAQPQAQGQQPQAPQTTPEGVPS